jgi:ubiquinone biosynthesis protein COQ4
VPDLRMAVILRIAQIVNPQISVDRQIDLDLDRLRQFPEGTLGYEVAKFIDCHGFDPIESGDWIQRTHDIWHVVTGLSPSIQDELTLQAFTRTQVFRPSSAIFVLIGLFTGRCSLHDICRGLKLGIVARSFLDWDIESDWATPLADVRCKLGLDPNSVDVSRTLSKEDRSLSIH